MRARLVVSNGIQNRADTGGNMRSKEARIAAASLVATLLGMPTVGAADPIRDLTMRPYVAGWFPNYYRGQGPLVCPKACRAWTRSEAENERATELSPTAERGFVCKLTRDPAIVQKPIDAPASHWIYGTQYDDLPVCYAETKGGGRVLSREFMCLCVADCRKPDLTVTNIHRPSWDGTKSVIDVDVTNVGAAPAPASTAELIDYELVGVSTTVATPPIAAGATVTVTFTLPYWVFDPNASLAVTADSKQEIDECDEMNNHRRFFELG